MVHTMPHPLPAQLAGEHTCVSYLFNKRWPWGFTCPFCGAVQKELTPAYTIVCRYCRKQTSITSRTLMHGSKKSLVAWMQVAWQFCARSQGLSARELQRLMALSSYETAWRWLVKMRCAASLAEALPCRGTVLLDVAKLPAAIFAQRTDCQVAMALEMVSCGETPARVRFEVCDPLSPQTMEAAIGRLILAGTKLLSTVEGLDNIEVLDSSYLLCEPSAWQLNQGRQLAHRCGTWLRSVFRGAIDVAGLQGYLDEYGFRHNTACCQEPMQMLDHLLTGLLSSPRLLDLPQATSMIGSRL